MLEDFSFDTSCQFGASLPCGSAHSTVIAVIISTIGESMYQRVTALIRGPFFLLKILMQSESTGARF